MLFATQSGRLPFGPLTVPTSAGIFPTDFSSHTSSADFLAAIADITADPLRSIVSFVSPRLRTHGSARLTSLPRHCSAGLPLLRRSFRRAVGSPGVLPCCFQCVTVRSTRGNISIAGGLIYVLKPRPCSSRLYLPTGGQFFPVYSVRSARIFASGFLQPALTERISAFHYTSALSTCDWTCSLTRTSFLLICCQ